MHFQVCSENKLQVASLRWQYSKRPKLQGCHLAFCLKQMKWFGRFWPFLINTEDNVIHFVKIFIKMALFEIDPIKRI